MGVTECDNMLMLLGVSSKFTEKARDVVIPLMMRGFKVSVEKNFIIERLVYLKIILKKIVLHPGYVNRFLLSLSVRFR